MAPDAVGSETIPLTLYGHGPDPDRPVKVDGGEETDLAEWHPEGPPLIENDPLCRGFAVFVQLGPDMRALSEGGEF